MVKVLIAEDEPRARESLARILTRDGQEVRSAATGRQAIDVGSSFMPDILVTDWMLKNHINGLHVSRALQAINDNLRTIMISGLPSTMYSKQLMTTGVFDLFEKPLEIERFLESVRRAASEEYGGEMQNAAMMPGIVRMTPDGDILHRNAQATALFDRVVPGKDIANLREIFPRDDVVSFPCDGVTRVGVGYDSGEITHWRICLKVLDNSHDKLVVLLPDGCAQKIDMETLRMLLGFPEPWSGVWPQKEMALVVDPDLASRRLVLAQLRMARARHKGASSLSEALQMLNEHPRIAIVIVDYALGVDAIRELMMKVDTGYSGASVIGVSTSDAQEELLRIVGCTKILRKPWGVGDLLDIVTGRL